MVSRALKIAKRIAIALAIVLVTLLAVRVFDTQRGPPLELWHTFVPDDVTAAEIDELDWAGYLAREQAVFDSVRAEVTDRLDPEAESEANRYYAGSPIYPGGFTYDWNRSYVLEPEGEAKGAAVFLHGLTDSPYSLRHLARQYRDRGFVAVAIRMPAHGTVPAALTEVEWQDWSAATRLAVREARRRIQVGKPLHVVGFSNGGALAMQYALDALDDPGLPRPDRLVLISPMIGITGFARFVGVAALPAFLPAFAKAAWLSLVPEFNPFKYNSFPVNGARQAHALTRALQQQINAKARAGTLEGVAPVLAFQSVVDFTVSTRAVISGLYNQLPANGSELVLFDLNRAAKFGLLMARSAEMRLTRLLPPPPRAFRTTIVTNATDATGQMVERVVEAGSTEEQLRPLGLAYPADIFSLSHVALPFPPTDALYGIAPSDEEDFGVNLGTMASRGEIGVLIVNLDFLMRLASNPFFPYLSDRVMQGVPSPGLAESAPAAAAP
jgi:alpha-beta hydrolase superfamily lysophospholipase